QRCPASRGTPGGTRPSAGALRACERPRVTSAMDGPRTRRELVGSAVIAAAGVSGLIGAEATAEAAAPPTDAGVLRRTLEIEQLVVIAYRRVLSSGALRPSVAGQGRAVLSQELQHVAHLERGLRGLGAL